MADQASAAKFAELLCAPFLRELGVTGAAVSTIGGLRHPETLGASDAIAGRVDEAQLDLGEGPCWDAVASGGWIDSPQFAGATETRWPAFRDAIRRDAVGGLFAYPLHIGGLRVGAVDLYTRVPGELSPAIKQDAETIAAGTARQVLRASLALFDQDEDDDDSRPRAVIHQATGMVLAQLEVTPDEALLLLRGRAFAEGAKLREIAHAVIDGRIDFSRADGGTHDAG